MGGNYGKGIYNQVMDVMVCLDNMEKDLKAEKKNTKKMLTG